MKITIDTESDLGHKLFCGIKHTKHFLVDCTGSGEMAAVTIYDRQGKELAHCGTWWMSNENITTQLMSKHKFSYQELKVIKKVYKDVCPELGYDSEE